MINIRETLNEYKSEELKNFSQKLIFSKYEIIGVKLPILRKIAKNLSDIEKISYLKQELVNPYYEEILVYGFVLGCSKIDYCDFLIYFYKYLCFVDNWSTCDSCVSSFKIIKNHREEFLDEIEKLLTSNKDFYKRVAFVVLLDFYLEEKYLNFIFLSCDNVSSENYYVKMAKAWLISFAFIKHKNNTLNYLKNNKLDVFTHNKAISKIIDSYRVDKLDKDLVKSLKR